MKIVVGLLLIFFSFSVLGQVVYQVDNKMVTFQRVAGKHLLLSQSCLNNTNNCIAMQVLAKATFLGIDPKKFADGANPGAIVCSEKLDGMVVMGIDLKNGNQQTFCKFPDESMISNGSISYYARSNVIK